MSRTSYISDIFMCYFFLFLFDSHECECKCSHQCSAVRLAVSPSVEKNWKGAIILDTYDKNIKLYIMVVLIYCTYTPVQTIFSRHHFVSRSL